MQIESPEDVAAEPPAQKISYSLWIVRSVGWPNLHILFLLMLLAAGLILYLSRRGRGPALAVVISLLIPMPLVAGCLISVRAAIDWLLALAMDSPLATTSFVADQWSRSILSILLGALFSVPLLVAGITVLLRPEWFRSRRPLQEATHG